LQNIPSKTYTRRT